MYQVSGSKVVEVTSFLLVKLRLDLVKCNPKYIPAVSVSVYMYLA